MLKKLLDDHILYMSEFQHDYLVTGRSGGTLYGQYKQSLRELYSRIHSLRELYCDHELIKIDIEETEHDLSTLEEGFERRRKDIEHKRQNMRMEGLERNIAETERETTSFYNQAIKLKRLVGEITPEIRNQHEKELWEFTCKRDAATDMMANGRISKNHLEFAMSFDGEERDRVFELFKNPDALIKEVEDMTKVHAGILNGQKSLPERINFRKLLT